MLALGLLAAGDNGREEQRRADPGQADPDDRRLDMDVTQEIERKVVVDRDPVKARPVVIGMGHDRAGGDLHQEQRRDDEKILPDASLARSQGTEHREHRVHRGVVGIIEEKLVDEQHDAESEEGEAETDPGPTERVGGRRVADQRLIGPVLRPRPCLTGPAGNRSERGVDQEIRRLPRDLRIETMSRGPTGRRVGDPKRLGDLVTHARHRCRDRFRQRHIRFGQVDALQIALHSGGGGRLLVLREAREGFGVYGHCNVVARGGAQPH